MVKQGQNLQGLYNKIIPNQNMTFNQTKESLINFLLDEGRIAYVHSKGFFPSLQPACYSPGVKAIKGAFLLMEWQDNSFVVEVSKGSMMMLRKLYEFQVDSLLISQVNWTKMLSQYGGEVNYFSEHSIGSIQKTASMVILRKVEAKKDFIIQQQSLQQTMSMESQEASQRLLTQQITQSLGNVIFTPSRLQQVDVNEQQQFQSAILTWIRTWVRQDYQGRSWSMELIGVGLYGLVLGGYIIGIISRSQLVLPDYQRIETLQGHCVTCGLYPNQEFHSCNGILVRK